MVAKREEKTGHKGNRRPRKRITVKEGEAEHASSDTPVEVQRLGNRQSSQVVGARGVGWRRTETRVRRCGGGRFAVHRGGRPALGASPFKLKAERTTRARPSGTRVGTPAINAAKRGKSAGAFGGCSPCPWQGPTVGALVKTHATGCCREGAPVSPLRHDQAWLGGETSLAPGSGNCFLAPVVQILKGAPVPRFRTRAVAPPAGPPRSSKNRACARVAP